MRAVLAVLVTLAFGAGAAAQERQYGWAHHGTQGDVGQREVVIYDQDSIDEAINPDISIFAAERDRYVLARLTIATVFEDAAQPGMVATDYSLHCRDRLSKPSMTYTYWRDGAFTAVPSDDFSPIVDGTPVADLFAMACKWAPREASARRRAMVKPFSREHIPIEDAWGALLPGVPRPAASATKSEVQIAAEQAHKAREDADRRESLAEAAQAREVLAAREAEDRAFLDNLLAWKASKGDGGHPVMHSWIGNRVSALTSSWGRPDEVRAWGGGQQLIYSSYGSRTIIQGVTPIGQEQYYCHQSFFTDRGYVVSWQVEGNNCQ